MELIKKYILRKLATKFLPENIAKRKKFPWGIPFYDFFKKEFLPIAECAIDKSFKEKKILFSKLKTSYTKSFSEYRQ